MNDIDHVLGDAGARLRGTAPSAEATETALATLGDVALDEDPGPRRLWIVAPAVLAAAAAAVIGVIVVTRPTEEAIVPADTTTVVPAPATTAAGPATTVPPVTIDDPSPTTSTIASIDLGSGVALQTTDVDFDGDGGACLTLSTSTDRVSGCADGPTMRSAFLNPLYVALDGEAYSLAPTGIDGNGDPDLFLGETAAPQCVLDAELVGVLVDSAGCDTDSGGILGTLPATAGGGTTWTVFAATSPADGLDVDLVTASESTGTRVFRSRATRAVPACLVVEGWNHVIRESCGLTGAGSLIAGSPDRPVVVEYDVAAGTASVVELDPTLPALANGCATGVGSLLAPLAPPVALTALQCVEGTALGGYGPTFVRPGSTESATTVLLPAGEEPPAVGDPEGGTPPCDQLAIGCAELGTGTEFDGALLPVPPATVWAFDFGDDLLEPRDDTERYAAIGAVADEAALYAAVDVAWRAIGDADTQSTPTYAGRSPLLVTFSRIPDELQESSVLAVWYTIGDDGLRIDTVIDAIGCARGTTELDDGTTGCF